MSISQLLEEVISSLRNSSIDSNVSKFSNGHGNLKFSRRRLGNLFMNLILKSFSMLWSMILPTVLKKDWTNYILSNSLKQKLNKELCHQAKRSKQLKKRRESAKLISNFQDNACGWSNNWVNGQNKLSNQNNSQKESLSCSILFLKHLQDLKLVRSRWQIQKNTISNRKICFQI